MNPPLRTPLLEPRWLAEIKRKGEYRSVERTAIAHLSKGSLIEIPLPRTTARDAFIHEMRLRGRTVRYDAKAREIVIE